MIAAAPAADFDRTIIDYLRVTSDEGRFLRDVLRGPIETLGRGLGVYPHAERDGYGAVYCAGGPEGGRFMLQLSGDPLESWRTEHKERDLIAHLASRNARCTRIDLARDTSGDWTPYRLRDYLDADRFVSPWRRAPVYTHERNGPLSVQLGSRTSDFMVRVYDKRGEMLAKDEACPHERLSRWEEEIKGDLAVSAFVHLWAAVQAENATSSDATHGETWPIHRLHPAWLGQRLRLTTEPVRRESKEQSRAKTDPAWTEFLTASNGYVLLPDSDKRTAAQQAEQFARWLVKGGSSSFAAFTALAGPDGVAELLRLGNERLSAKHRMFIERIAETRPVVRAVVGLSPSSDGRGGNVIG